MRTFGCTRIGLAIAAAALFVQPTFVAAQTSTAPAKAVSGHGTAHSNGQHAFDFLPGTWKGFVKRRLHPLTGSTKWVRYDATSVVRKFWDGRANIDDFKADGPAGHIAGLTLRTYNPKTNQWSLYWTNGNTGGSLQPQVGEFKNGRGEFYAQDTYDGKTIFIRYVWSDMSHDSYHFEQSFSDDGGKTWEVNWISTMTRVKE